MKFTQWPKNFFLYGSQSAALQKPVNKSNENVFSIKHELHYVPKIRNSVSNSMQFNGHNSVNVSVYDTITAYKSLKEVSDRSRDFIAAADRILRL